MNQKIYFYIFIAIPLILASIAEKLVISESTVKNHIHRMLEKTGCESRTELAIEARISGIAIKI